jgi:hypothetical protein
MDSIGLNWPIHSNPKAPQSLRIVQAPNYSTLCLWFCECHIHKTFNVLMLCSFANGLHRFAFTCTPKTQCSLKLKNCPDSKLLWTSQLCLWFYEFLVSCVWLEEAGGLPCSILITNQRPKTISTSPSLHTTKLIHNHTILQYILSC